jgi:hypothetical protein
LGHARGRFSSASNLSRDHGAPKREDGALRSTR